MSRTSGHSDIPAAHSLDPLVLATLDSAHLHKLLKPSLQQAVLTTDESLIYTEVSSRIQAGTLHPPQMFDLLFVAASNGLWNPLRVRIEHSLQSNPQLGNALVEHICQRKKCSAPTVSGSSSGESHEHVATAVFEVDGARHESGLRSAATRSVAEYRARLAAVLRSAGVTIESPTPIETFSLSGETLTGFEKINLAFQFLPDASKVIILECDGLLHSLIGSQPFESPLFGATLQFEAKEAANLGRPGVQVTISLRTAEGRVLGQNSVVHQNQDQAVFQLTQQAALALESQGLIIIPSEAKMILASENEETAAVRSGYEFPHVELTKLETSGRIKSYSLQVRKLKDLRNSYFLFSATAILPNNTSVESATFLVPGHKLGKHLAHSALLEKVLGTLLPA